MVCISVTLTVWACNHLRSVPSMISSEMSVGCSWQLYIEHEWMNHAWVTLKYSYAHKLTTFIPNTHVSLTGRLTRSNPAICFIAIRALLLAFGLLGQNRVYLAKKHQCGRFKDLLSLLGVGPFLMKVPEWSRFVSWCAPGIDWHQSTFSNLRISRWSLNS